VWPTVRAAFTAANVAQPFYWVAAYPGSGANVPPGAVAHQWIDHGPYDESVTVDWWPPHVSPPQPTPPIPPPTVDPRGDLMLHTITMPTDSNGNAAVVCDGGTNSVPGISSVAAVIPWSSFEAVSMQGSDPAADGGYWPGSAHVQNRGGHVLVSVTGYMPKVPATVFVLATS
jgi:hypothetical protein